MKFDPEKHEVITQGNASNIRCKTCNKYYDRCICGKEKFKIAKAMKRACPHTHVHICVIGKCKYDKYCTPKTVRLVVGDSTAEELAKEIKL